MIVLGSSYIDVTRALAAQLPDHEVRAFDPARPLTEQLADVEVLILGGHLVPAEVLAAAPRLRLVHQHGAGLQNLDRAAAARQGVLVARAPGGNADAVGEFALGLILHLSRQLHRAQSSIRARERGWPTGRELRGATLGVVGLGASGTALARRARALGMRVVGIVRDPSRAREPVAELLGGPEKLGELLAMSDFVSLHLPLDDSTRSLVGAAELARMRRDACLVNVGRAAVVDYDALSAALGAGDIAAAAFDVFWREPADPDDPILALPNFVLTPHMAGFTRESIAAVTAVIADNVERLASGRPLTNLAAPP